MVRSSYLERNFGQKTTLPFFSLFEGYSFLWSALSKMSYLLNPDITVGCIIRKGCSSIVMTLVVLTTTQGGPIHPHHALLVAQGGVPATHQPGAGGGAGEGYGGS